MSDDTNHIEVLRELNALCLSRRLTSAECVEFYAAITALSARAGEGGHLSPVPSDLVEKAARHACRVQGIDPDQKWMRGMEQRQWERLASTVHAALHYCRYTAAPQPAQAGASAEQVAFERWARPQWGHDLEAFKIVNGRPQDRLGLCWEYNGNKVQAAWAAWIERAMLTTPASAEPGEASKPACQFCLGDGYLHDADMICNRCNGTGIEPCA